jgi:transposase-like protein
MEREFLVKCLGDGMSLPQIGRLVGKDPSTVGYWVKKHGLETVGSKRHAPNGRVDADRLRQLVAREMTLRQMAAEFGVSFSTIRHWLKRLGLETASMRLRRQTAEAKQLGLKRIYRKCPRHGHTAFYLRPDGGYRCMRCNTAGVAERRRRVKRQLIEEFGGGCAACGFSEHPAALHFHHLDPSTKEFMVSRGGITRSFAETLSEARKCVLLCANCHAIVEAGTAKATLEGR